MPVCRLQIGGFLDEMVVVGGLVPHLLVGTSNAQSRLGDHPGTIDLDLGIDLALLGDSRYRELSERLRDAGFKPDVNNRDNLTPQRWTSGTPRPVTIDFLMPPSGETDSSRRIMHIDSDLAAIVTPGLELALADRTWIDLADHLPNGALVSRSIPVCGAGAFTVLKALAFGNRTRNKDAYDLFYVWDALGIEEVAERLALLRPNSSVDEALKIIRKDFFDLDGPGPTGVSGFLGRVKDDELQADVSGQARALCQFAADLGNQRPNPG